MMKKCKKKLIFLLVLAIFSTALIGCGNKEKTPVDKPGSTQANDKKDANNMNKDEDDKPKEVVKLTWYIRGNETDIGVKAFEEVNRLANTETELIVITENQDDQYKMMIASGNYPDLIRWTNALTYPGGVPKLVNDGVAIELNDLIDNHMPNLKKILEEKPNIRKQMTNDEGKYQFFANINPLESDIDKSIASTTGFAMRSDWLENIGLDIPTNMDEWYNVLTAFKNNDPNGDGANNEVPFEGTGLDMFAPAFGIRRTYFIRPETGKVAFGPIEPEYKEYLATLNKWYNEGLIGPNSILTDGKLTDANITADIAGSFKALTNAWEKYLPALQEKNPNADFVPVPWPKTVDGIAYTDRTELMNHINKETTIITSSCKNPEAAARLIDYMYSDEGSFLLSWGFEGESYEIVDGKYQFIEYPKDGDVQVSHFVKPHVAWPKYGYTEAHANMFKPVRLVAADAWAQGVDSSLIYPPAIIFSEEETNTIIDINGDMGSYVQDMTNKFITGEEPLSNFDTYVQNVKKFGVEKIIQIHEENLARYNNKK